VLGQRDDQLNIDVNTEQSFNVRQNWTYFITLHQIVWYYTIQHMVCSWHSCFKFINNVAPWSPVLSVLLFTGPQRFTNILHKVPQYQQLYRKAA